MVGMYIDPYWRQKAEAEAKKKQEQDRQEALQRENEAYQRQRSRELSEQEQARNAARQESIRAAQTAASTNSGYQTNNQGLTAYGSGNPGSGGSGGSGGGSGGSGGGADDWRARLELQAKLIADAEARRMQTIREMQNSMNTRGPVTPPDFSAANAAAFARAKDMVGLQQRSAMNSLRDYYSGSGQSGMGAAGRAAIGQGLDQLGEVTRDQAIADANRNADFAKLTYQGDIEQRQQNMQYMAQLLGLLNAQAY